ncbi:MAG TPA: hypothetical protein DER09_11445 [Prolixibacteraceae bacterium]|nr:hypothetical protein [Prolixibacteraceae bacterium]
MFVVFAFIGLNGVGQISVGPKEAGNGTNLTVVGSVAWTNPSNIATTIINDYSHVTLNNNASNYLVGTNYGFVIPTNAIVVGIEVTIGKNRESGRDNVMVDNEVRLIKNGVVIGANYADGTTNWNRDNQVREAIYGGPNDLWNTTWTPSEINANNFGAAISAITSQNIYANVYYIRITITYTTPFFFRSTATGNWSTTSTWQQSNDGTTWVAATSTPTSSNSTSILVRNGNIVTVDNNLNVDDLTIETGGQVTVNSNRTLTIANGTGTDLTVNGTLRNLGTVVTTGTLAFGNGSIYDHARDGGVIPTATWDPNSNCDITGITNVNVTGLNQTFGNFTWNCASQGTNNIISTTGNIVVNGDFRLTNGIFALSASTSAQRTLTIAGDYIQTVGIFDFNRVDNGLLSTLYIAGDYINSAAAGSIVTGGNGAVNGNVVFNGSSQQNLILTSANAAIWTSFIVNAGSNLKLGSDVTLTGDGSEPKYYADFNVSGTVDFSNYILSDIPYNNSTNASHFTLNSGAELITANTAGISLSGATGSVQVTSTRTYNTGANYTYNGSTAQVTGNGLTGADNLTINNSAGVTLSAATAISGNVALTNGKLITSSTNLLRVTNNSTTAITGASTTRFVDGPMRWTLAPGSSYTFPVGDGSTYLPFGLSNVTGTAPLITAEAVSGNSGGTASSPLSSLSTTEYWNAQISGGTYTNGTVSLTRQSDLSGIDAIGRSVTVDGAYSNLNGTVSGTSIINSDATGNSLGFFAMAAKRSITVGTISPVSYCPGASISIPYTITGTFNAGNVFTAQLSDAAGSFASPVAIGSVTSTTSGIISATLPGSANGSGYRVRVVSSVPSVTSNDNGVDITIGSPQIVTSPGSQCKYADNVDVTISASSSLTGIFRWYDSGYTLLKTDNSVGESSYIADNISSTTTYYVTFESGGCITPYTEVKAYVIEPPSLDASAGGSFCAGSDINLYSAGSYDNLYWDGPNDFYSTDEDPVITNASTGMSGTYTVHTNSLSGVNLVYNGNFEFGNVGFETDYTLDEVYVHPEGEYAIVNDPNSVHPGFTNCPPVSGDLQMVINGSTDINIPVIWRQTVNVVPGTDYQFTYWVQSVVASNPSILQLYVNDVEAGPEYVAETATCIWKQFLYNWSSGTATIAKLELRNKNVIAGGNDFALDSLVFQHTCTSDASVEVFVSNIFTPSVSIAASPSNAVCSGQQVTFSATPTNGGSSPAYQWNVNGVNAGSDSSSYTYSPANNDIVTCVMTSDLSCVTSANATSNEITMAVNPIPSATISGSATICDGQTAPIQIDFTGTGPWEVTTQRNDAEPVTVFDITDNPYIFYVSTAGTYTISAFNDDLCDGTFSGNAVVTVNPLPTITLSSTNAEVCFGDVVTSFAYSATTGSPNQYSIDFDQNAIDEGFVNVTNSVLTGGAIDIAVPATGAPDTYYADLTIRNSTTGCTSAIYNITIIIHPLPETSEIQTN